MVLGTWRTWSAVGRTLWEGLGDMALLEEVCHGALRFRKTHGTPSVLSVAPTRTSGCELSSILSTVLLFHHHGL